MTKYNSDEMVELMFKTFRKMKEEMSYKDSINHLSALQIHALIFLKHREKTNMGDIAAYFNIELPSATSLMNNLCVNGLIKREEDKNDRRLVLVNLTDKGKTLLKQVMELRRKKIEKILSYLSVREKEDLYNIFNTLYGRL